MTLRCDRRTAIVGSIAVSAMAGLPANALRAKANDIRWRGAWGAAMQPPPDTKSVPPGTKLTRNITSSLTGDLLRLRISNRYGNKPLKVAASANRSMATFGRLSTFTIPPGATVLSDPIEVTISGGQIEIAVILPDGGVLTDIERTADRGGAMLDMPGSPPALTYPALLTEVDVLTSANRVIAILGDTKSARPDSWADLLASRSGGHVGIVNRSIYGGKLALGEGSSSGLARFDHDVLGTSGVTDVLLFCGNNGLIQPGMIGSSGRPALDPSLMLSLADLQALMRQVIARAHAGGVRVIGATWLPYEGVTIAEGYSTPEKMELRSQLNDWIRTSGELDEVIDFDAALRDPGHPTRLNPSFDNGNHFTPNSEGIELMAKVAQETLLSHSDPTNL